MRISISLFFVCIFLMNCANSGDSVSNTGKGGSLSRFAIKNDFLYVASNSTIQVFSISKNNLESLNSIHVSFGLETIFAKDDYLYLGSNDAMYIYSIKNPEKPEFVFRYSHITSCDPVIVQGNLAYVTLKVGNCRTGTNTLEILDISDPNSPVLLQSYPMKSPGGMGIDGGCLFVCQDKNGLAVLDVSDPKSISETMSIENVNAYDVITNNGVLILTGEDGIFQYSYDCAKKDIKLISKIPVERAAL
jgi:hypothetical protein